MRVVDLFCGSGGFSLGMQRAGHTVVAGFDYEPAALAVHAANIVPTGLWSRLATVPGHHEADLSDLLAHAPYIAELCPEIIVGGPPCVAFSTANPKRGDHNPEASLLDAFSTCVMVARPRYLAMENVPGAVKSDFWDRACRLLERAGYGLTTYRLDMSWYGVGQARERVFLLGCLGEAANWAASYLDAAKHDRQTTVRDVLGPDGCDELYFNLGHRAEKKGQKDRDPTKGRRSFWSTSEPGATITSTSDRLSTSPQGYVVRQADVDFFKSRGLYFSYPGGASSAGTYRLDDPSPTLTRNSCYGPNAKYELRKGDILEVRDLPILPFEAVAALAGYPADYVWHPNPKKPTGKVKRMRMVANSVPAPVSELIGRTIAQHARGEQPTVAADLPEGFVEWLAGPGGIATANVKQRAAEARSALRLLGSRRFQFEDDAVRHLESMKTFKAIPSSPRRSNVAGALRLLARYEATFNVFDERAPVNGADRAEVDNPFPAGFRLRPTSRVEIDQSA